MVKKIGGNFMYKCALEASSWNQRLWKWQASNPAELTISLGCVSSFATIQKFPVTFQGLYPVPKGILEMKMVLFFFFN